jgi:hypothetical protein
MKVFYTLALGLFLSPVVQAQDMLDELGNDDTLVERVTNSFKNTKVINAQSLETTSKGVLDFRISHRFGPVSGGAYEFFGLDQASLRLSFDYGITKRLEAGIGRSTFEKTYDGYLKYRLLWQTENSNKMPVSVVLYTNMAVNTLHMDVPYDYKFEYRLCYVHQVIIGRKFNKNLSLELLPTIIHRNFVLLNVEKNTAFAIGAAGRYMLTRRMGITAEYFYVLPDQLRPGVYNSLSVGVDIETGGHVFQLHFTNSFNMTDKGYLVETTNQWNKMGISLGFNISRVFTIVKPKID